MESALQGVFNTKDINERKLLEDIVLKRQNDLSKWLNEEVEN